MERITHNLTLKDLSDMLARMSPEGTAILYATEAASESTTFVSIASVNLTTISAIDGILAILQNFPREAIIAISMLRDNPLKLKQLIGESFNLELARIMRQALNDPSPESVIIHYATHDMPSYEEPHHDTH